MDKISNELYISIIVSMIGVIIGGITFNYPILTSKHNRNDPDYGWKYILRECQPIFLLTYEKYGWIGSIHQVWYDWFPWFFSFIYITLILFKMFGYSISINNKTTPFNHNDFIVILLLLFIPNIPFYIYFRYIENKN